MRNIILGSIFLISLAVPQVAAQSGGNFEITQSVIAPGGHQSSNGNIVLDSTIGQPDAGNPIGSGNFAIAQGFWGFTPLAPTAAGVSIAGRVINSDGVGISNAVLYLQPAEGDYLVARSSPFGYYLFEDVRAGQHVFITVEHKLFSFQPRTMTVLDNVTDIDFVGEPRN